MKEELLFDGGYDPDELTRMCCSLLKFCEGEQEEARRKWKTCKHKFVLVRPYNYEYDKGIFFSRTEYIPPRYECVECGLTNRFMDIEKKHIISVDGRYVTAESTEWVEQFGRNNEKMPAKSVITYKLLDSPQPTVLYRAAKQICQVAGTDTTDKNVFEVMERLNKPEDGQKKCKMHPRRRCREDGDKKTSHTMRIGRRTGRASTSAGTNT